MLAAAPLFGQCTLTAAKAPKLLGFKLGMAQAAAETMLGVTAKVELHHASRRRRHTGDKSYDLGEKSINIENKNNDAKGLDASVDTLDLSFFEGKLYEIGVEGNEKTDWFNAPDVHAWFQKQYGIPARAWQPYGLDKAEDVQCSGVLIRYLLDKSYHYASFSIYDTDTQKRIEKAFEAAKAADKP